MPGTSVEGQDQRSRKNEKRTVCAQKKIVSFANAVCPYRKNPQQLTVVDNSPLTGKKKDHVKAIYEQRCLATQMQFFCDDTHKTQVQVPVPGTVDDVAETFTNDN